MTKPRFQQFNDTGAKMILCSRPKCQTTAGCKCRAVGAIIPPITTEHAWKAAYELAKADNERLRAALEVLNELHALLDFEEPMSDEKPWLFEDCVDINAAFAKAYQVICAARDQQSRSSSNG